jgi:hypothetical protein
MKITALSSSLIMCLSLIASSAEKPVISTDSGRTGMEVTVYNNNIGLVKDTRKIRLPAGYGELRFSDVASSIMPVTVRAVSLSNPEELRILEQNYEYDLMSPEKLLDKYVGKKIKLLDINKYTGKRDTTDAELLSSNNGLIYKINNEIFLEHPGMKILPSIPENLIAVPTLMWLFESRRAAEHRIEVTYITGDISWTADYILVLDKDDAKSGLSGWVSIDNRSGGEYKDAKLTLIAGKLNMVPQERVGMLQSKRAVSASYQPEPSFEEKEIFEYHMYTLQHPSSIKNNQTKQIQLFQSDRFDTQKELITEPAPRIFGRRSEESAKRQPVNVFITFSNTKKNSLGMPLPSGAVRVYKKDDSDALQFLGEDRIDHTPENEKLRLKIGEAFDVVTERLQKSYSETGSRANESEWEITVRNHKKQAVNVGIVERLNGEWKILSKSHDFDKIDAFTIRFNVNVAAGGETKVTYRSRTQW